METHVNIPLSKEIIKKYNKDETGSLWQEIKILSERESKMRKIFLFVLMFTFSGSLSVEADECTGNDNEIYAFNMVEKAYASNVSKRDSAECRAADPEVFKKEMAKPEVRKVIDIILNNEEYICDSTAGNEGIGSVEKATGVHYALYRIKKEEGLRFNPKVEHVVTRVKCTAILTQKKYSLIGIGIYGVNGAFLHSVMNYIDKKDRAYERECSIKTNKKDSEYASPWGDYFFNPVDASGKRVHSVLDELVELIVFSSSFPEVSIVRRKLFNNIKGRGGKCSPEIEAQEKYKDLCNRHHFKL